MHVVAIHSLTEDRLNKGKPLASVLGVTAYDALSRLRVPGNGPLVVGVYAEKEHAARIAEQLRAWFHVVVLSSDEISFEKDQCNAKRFRLGETGLEVESDRGCSLSSAYKDIELILRGTAISGSTSTETSKDRKFSLGQAVMTGGISFTRTTQTVREVRTEEREGFFVLYAGDSPPVVFRGSSLHYDSLGSACGPSSAANFAHLVSELRGRCTNAIYDESLLNRASQAALLGPLLRPEDHLAVATALLSKVLRGRA